MSRLVNELQGTDFWKLRRSYSPGVGLFLFSIFSFFIITSNRVSVISFGVVLQVQEYVEAATFCRFCRAGTLLHLDEMNSKLLPLSDPSIAPLQINILDYLLGVIT